MFQHKSCYTCCTYQGSNIHIEVICIVWYKPSNYVYLPLEFLPFTFFTKTEGEEDEKTVLKDDVHVPAKNLAAEKKTLDLRAKMALIREKRLINKKLGYEFTFSLYKCSSETLLLTMELLISFFKWIYFHCSKVKTLGDAESEDEDNALGWVKKSRKVQVEKEAAAKRVSNHLP